MHPLHHDLCKDSQVRGTNCIRLGTLHMKTAQDQRGTALLSLRHEYQTTIRRPDTHRNDRIIGLVGDDVE